MNTGNEPKEYDQNRVVSSNHHVSGINGALDNKAHKITAMTRLSNLLRSKKAKFVILSVILICSMIVAYFYIATSNTRLQPEEVIDKSNSYINQSDYQAAYKLLKANQNREEFEGSVEFFVLLSRSAVLTNRNEEAKQYAKAGAEYYADSKDRKASDGYILQSILSGTYVDERVRIDTKDKPVVPVQKEQLEDPEFQG